MGALWPQRLSVLLTLLVLMGVAFGVRVIPAVPVIFPEQGSAKLLGVDAYVLYRHSLFTVEHYPQQQRQDIGSHYPQNHHSDAAGLFNLLVATVAHVVTLGQPSPDTVLRVSAWLPPILATLTLIPLYLLGASWMHWQGGLLTCLLFVLYPGSALPRSVLGFADYHVLEIFLAACIALGLWHTIHRYQSTIWWKPAFLPALPLVLLLFTWKGAPLFLIAIGLSFWIIATFEIARHKDPWPVGIAMIRYGLGVCLPFLGLALLFPDWRIEVISGLSRWIALAIVVLTLGPALYLYGGLKLRHYTHSPLATAIGMAVTTLAALGIYLFFTQQGEWVAHQLFAPRTPSVQEHRPITEANYWFTFGGPGRLALASLPLALFAIWRRPHQSRQLTPTILGFFFFGIWWQTNDTEYHTPLFVALLAAYTLIACERWLRLWIHSTPSLRPYRQACRYGLPIALGILLAAPLWPLGNVHAPWLSREEVNSMVAADEGWHQAMDWMRSATPEPPVTPVSPVTPTFRHPETSYGIMTAWDYGNFVAVRGQRIPMASRWPSFTSAAWLAAEDEATSLPLLCPYCEAPQHVRYAVINAHMASSYFLTKAQIAGRTLADYGPTFEPVEIDGRSISLTFFGPSYDRSMAARLYRENGQGMQHYRLIYESPAQSYIGYEANPVRSYLTAQTLSTPASLRLAEDLVEKQAVNTPLGIVYGGSIHSSVKVFEIVPGATIQGNAEAATQVHISLPLYAQATGRHWSYNQTTHTDDQGHFSITVPYSTDTLSTSDVYATNRYLISFPTAQSTIEGSLHIPESAIQRRDTLHISLSP